MRGGRKNGSEAWAQGPGFFYFSEVFMMNRKRMIIGIFLLGLGGPSALASTALPGRATHGLFLDTARDADQSPDSAKPQDDSQLTNDDGQPETADA